MEVSKKSTILVPGKYRVYRSLTPSDPTFQYYITCIDSYINDYNYLHYRARESMKVVTEFLPLDACKSGAAIMIHVNEVVNHDKILLNLSLRSVYALMQEKDPLLQTVIGKNIIIPSSYQARFGNDARSIVFVSVSETAPRWKLEAIETRKLIGAGSVWPKVNMV